MNRRQIEESIRRVGFRYPEYIYELSYIRLYKEVPGMAEQVGGPIGVDEHWRLYWDPDHEVPDTREGRARMDTFILHELGHLNGYDADRAKELAAGESIVLRMMGRDASAEAGPVSQMVWNMSCDARINAELRKLPWTKTQDLVFPESLKPEWDDRSGHFPVKPPEWYYTELRDGASSGGEGEDGDGQGGGIPIPGAAKHKGKGHSCGSVAHGQPHPWEDAPDDDCPSQDERDAIIEHTERQIAQKMVDGKQLGSGRDPENPDKVQSYGNNAEFPMLLDPEKIRNAYNHALWLDTIQRLLYQHLEQAKRTYMLPHRRIPGLPGKRRFPKQAVLVCDISGSINELSVKRTFEVCDRLFGRGFDLKIVACDTQAHVVEDRKGRYSGGGTDMGEGVRFAAERFPRAALIVVVTDGHSPWQEEKPTGIPVAVLSWGARGPQWAVNIPMPGLTDDYPVKPDWSRYE